LSLPSNPPTGCTCTEAGWCERHQCHKTAHWVELCQTHPGYWQLWEEQRGPGQIPKAGTVAKQKPDQSAWGDRLHDWLESYGITEDKYKAVKQKFGLPPKCNCAARREWLNRVGEWMTSQQKEE